MKKILVLILLGVITILTPLSFKANYYSIDQPVIDLNNYTLNEVFTDTINDLEQYKITSILDLQVYEGLSLRDIFDDNQWLIDMLLGNNVILPNGIEDILRYDNGAYVLDKYVDAGSNLLTERITQPINFASGWATIGDGAVVDGTSFSTTSGGGITFSNAGVSGKWLLITIRGTRTAGTSSLIIRNTGSTVGQFTLSDASFSRTMLVNWETNTQLYLASFSPSTFRIDELSIKVVDTISTTPLNPSFSYKDNPLYQLATPLLADETTGSIFTIEPSQLQLDEWLSFYLDPSTIASFDTIGDVTFYKAGTSFYNLTEMSNDKVYSTFNLDTFDNLTEGEITDQFGAWQTLGIEDIEVLSLTEFQTFAPALDQEDMLYWFNYYNLILEYDEVQAGILSDLEITILIIALVLFIIGIALAIYFHHKIMFFVTGLLWFVPIVIVPNIFIITFSVIMIIIFGLLAFYNSQGKDFD